MVGGPAGYPFPANQITFQRTRLRARGTLVPLTLSYFTTSSPVKNSSRAGLEMAEMVLKTSGRKILAGNGPSCHARLFSHHFPLPDIYDAALPHFLPRTGHFRPEALRGFEKWPDFDRRGAGVAKSGWPESRMAGSYQLSTSPLVRSTGSLSQPGYQLMSIHSGVARSVPTSVPTLHTSNPHQYRFVPTSQPYA